MSLVEALAALAILATVAGMVLTARARCLRQWTVAGRRLEAAKAAEALLEAWWQNPQSLPRSASGPLAGQDQMRWRTSVVRELDPPLTGVQVVRMCILDERAAPPQVLVQVDLVLEKPAEEARP